MRTILAILLAAMMLAVPLALAKESAEADDDDGADKAAKEKSGKSGRDENKTRDGHNETADDANESHDEDDDANKTKEASNKTRGGKRADEHNETSGDGKERANKTERLAARQARADLFDSLLARLQGLRTSWLENATAIRAECHAIETGENATENKTRAQCIRDGYAAWREDNRAAIEDLRADLKALAKGGRDE